MMRLLGVLVVLLALVAGFGYYRGWFQAQEIGTANGQTTITVTVDKNKIDQDKAKAQQEVQKVENK
jgi:hypothetical protein